MAKRMFRGSGGRKTRVTATVTLEPDEVAQVLTRRFRRGEPVHFGTVQDMNSDLRVEVASRGVSGVSKVVVDPWIRDSVSLLTGGAEEVPEGAVSGRRGRAPDAHAT